MLFYVTVKNISLKSKLSVLDAAEETGVPEKKTHRSSANELTNFLSPEICSEWD